MKKKEGVLDEEILFQILSLMLVLSMVMGGAAIPAWATENMPPEETVLETSEPTEANSETSDPEETVPETGESEETEPVELPPVTTSDGHYVAWPSLLENFDFPDDWSTAALEFCVGNRIIEGRDDGLTANEYTTRAETAAILVRMLGAKADPSALSGYQDVNPQAWYYDEVSAAVAVGLMKGTSNTTINPNARLTREDACVLLSRAFGILPVDNHQYETFSDAASVSKYARSAVSGLIELGVVKGYTDNTFRPKANITRAELAKLVYEAVTHICDSVDQLPGNGRVLYRGTEDIPQGYQLSGSLILGYGYSGSGVVDGVKVTGRLALSCTPGTWIDLKDCTLSQLTVSSKINVTGDSKAVYLMIGEEGSVVDVEANQVRVFKDCTLEGAYGRIHVVADGLCVTLNGSADNVYLYCTYTTLQGAGYAEAVDIYEKNCDVTLDCGICTDHIYLAAYNSALSTVQTVDSW